MTEIDWSKAPEGATHYADGSQIQCWYKDVTEIGYQFRNEGMSRWVCERGKPEWPLIPKPAQTWNGQGLPPVGSICEYYANEDEWRQCIVVAHHLDHAVVFVHLNHIFTTKGSILRPIRTPEQIAAEERKEAIDQMVQFFMNYYGNPKGAEQFFFICRSLYDAGYRKQEPKP